MKWSLKIVTVAGIKIYIHWTFIFLIAWIIMSGLGTGKTVPQSLYTLVFIFSVFFCVVLHELGHALVAKHYKYITRDITLLPIGGIARMDELPENPKQELLVAIAGPAVNFAIAIVLWPFVYWLGKAPTFTTILFNSKETFLFDIFMVNLALGSFNLIPAFPMDGGRILRAALAMKMPRIRATELAARTGQFIAILFFFVGLFYNPLLTFIGIFVFLMAQAETELVRSRSIMQNYKIKDVTMHKYYTIDSSAPITDAINLLMDVQARDFLVTEHGHVVGTLSSHDIIKILAKKGNGALVLDAMKTNFKSLSSDMPINKAYQELKGDSITIIPVIDNGQLTGIVDLNNILELILMKEASHNNFSQVKENHNIAA